MIEYKAITVSVPHSCVLTYGWREPAGGTSCPPAALVMGTCSAERVFQFFPMLDVC